MRYLIVGAGGQLGAALTSLLPDAHAYTHAELDISNEKVLKEVFDKVQPNIIINAGAYTNVEGAETDLSTAFHANAIGPTLLAKLANEINATLVHISTDYVFDGSKEGFVEEDTANPVNVYGISKLAGEQGVRAYCPSHYIVRVSALFGPLADSVGNNFVTKRLEQMRSGDTITMVNDQWTVPTYTHDLVKLIQALLEQKAPYGTYHGVNTGGGVTWYEFTKIIAETACVATEISPITTLESGTLLKRPEKSILLDTKLKALGIEMPSWQDALKRYIQDYLIK